MIWSSPSLRAKESATIIAQIFNNKLINLDKRLMEACHGSFEGKNVTDIGYHDHPHYAARKAIEDPLVKFNTSFGPPDEPGVENGAQVYARVREFFDEIALKYPQCAHIVVTHGGPINSMCKVLTGDYRSGERVNPAATISFNYNRAEGSIQIVGELK